MLHLMSTAPICQEGIYFSLRGGLLALLRAIFWLTPVDNLCSVSPSVGAVFSVRALVPPHPRIASQRPTPRRRRPLAHVVSPLPCQALLEQLQHQQAFTRRDVAGGPGCLVRGEIEQPAGRQRADQGLQEARRIAFEALILIGLA